LVALVLVSALSLLFIRADVSSASLRQASTVEWAIDSAISKSYVRAGGWSTSDLAPILALAKDLNLQIAILDRQGKMVIANTAANGGASASNRSPLPVMVDGSEVGTLELEVGPGGVLRGTPHLEASIALAVTGSGAIVILFAIGVSFIVSRRVARPLVALTAAAQSLTEGNWTTRVGPRAGPREIDELAESFDSMAAALEREDELRRTLTAEVAHELRTPLAVLQASSEALVDGVLPPTEATFQSINDETLRLSRLIEDLEALASAQAARLHLATDVVALDKLAGDVAVALSVQFENAGVDLEVRLLPTVVLGDESRLRQVVTNLLTNAAKFTPPGGHVVLEVDVAGSNHAVLSVADSGVGISKNEISQLFEHFWRSPSADKVTGSGIGLAVVAELVAAHHGSVNVESELGHGSRFIVTLPLAQRSSERFLDS
jgi:signal transduction histidine kinase